jgi:hypothetical protein
VILDVLGGIGWVGVGPCQIGEAFALDVDVVIAGNALPRAGLWASPVQLQYGGEFSLQTCLHRRALCDRVDVLIATLSHK